MNFLVDNQLPPALARFIQTELKCPAIHVTDVGMRDALDAEVWTYASEKNSILVTKDEDFATMVLQIPTTSLIWIRVGNCRKAFLLDLFRKVWPQILERLESGDRIIEIR